MTGAALATALSQVASTAILLWIITRRGILRLEHLAQSPAPAEIRRMLVQGTQLQTRSIAVLGR